MNKTVCLSAVGKVVQESQVTQVSNLKTKLLVAAKCHSWVKWLPRRQESLSSDPQYAQRSKIWWLLLIIPALGTRGLLPSSTLSWIYQYHLRWGLWPWFCSWNTQEPLFKAFAYVFVAHLRDLVVQFNAITSESFFLCTTCKGNCSPHLWPTAHLIILTDTLSPRLCHLWFELPLEFCTPSHGFCTRPGSCYCVSGV